MKFLPWIEHVRSNLRPQRAFAMYQGLDWILHSRLSLQLPKQVLCEDPYLRMMAWWPNGPDVSIEETPAGYSTAIKVLMGSGVVRTIDSRRREYHLHPIFQPMVVIPSDTHWVLTGSNHHEMVVTLQLTYPTQMKAML